MSEPGRGVSVRRVTLEDLELLKRLRLAALADAPHAFCARLSDEEAMPESAWRARVASNAEGVQTVGFFAIVDGAPRGMVVGVLDARRARTAELNALWVAPEGRGRGAARALVEAVCGWARGRGCDTVRLRVIDENAPALGLYLSCGFRKTGERRPQADRGGWEVELERGISS